VTLSITSIQSCKGSEITWKAALSIAIREVSTRKLNKDKFLHGRASLIAFPAKMVFFSYLGRKAGSRKASPNKNAYSDLPDYHPKVSPMPVYNIHLAKIFIDKNLGLHYAFFNSGKKIRIVLPQRFLF
jgi:hypothetical protein